MIAFNRTLLKNAIRVSIGRVYKAQTEDLDLYRNTLDCFSALPRCNWHIRFDLNFTS